MFYRLVTFAVLMMSAVSLPALAQPALEEVIVTAQKREQSLQDVPIAVTAVTGEALENNLVADIYDLQASVPSLQVQAVDPPAAGTAFALRGLGNSVFNLGFDPAVATFVDGVYRSRSGLLAASDFLDVERVEVLKGPQGTLFGKNTTAGVIHFISKRPEFGESSGYVQGGYEEYGRYRLQGSYNVSLSDQAALRIGATYAKGDGWIDLVGSGEEIHDLDRFALKAQLLLEPNDNLSIHFVADYATLDEICCVPLRGRIDPNSATVNAAAASAAGSGIVARPDLDGLTAESNLPPVYEATDRGLSLEVNWDIGGVSLTSITGYRDFDDTNNKDNDFSGVDVLQSNQNLPEVGLLSQELRLAGSAEVGNGRGVEWMTGLFFSNEDIELTNEFIWGPDIVNFPVLNLPPGPVPLPGLFGNTPGRAFFHRFDQDIDSKGLFAHASFDLSDRWALTLGGRYSDDEKEGTLRSDHPLTNAFGLFNSLPLAVVYDYDAQQEDSEFTYSASLEFRPSDSVMTFLTLSHGYKSGGISMTRDAAGNAAFLGDPVAGCPPGSTPLGGPLCAGPRFEPTFEREEADHIEIGVKSDLLDGRMRLNASIWRTEFENLQTQTLRADGAFAVVNIDGASSQGLEIETDFAATENTTLTAAIQYLDATFDSGQPPLTPGFPPLGGQDLPFSSDVTASIGVNYRKPLTQGPWTFFANGNLYYRSEYFNFTEPTNDRVQDGYTLLNLRVGFETEQWQFSLSCRNCTDERYTWSNFAIPFDGLLLGHGSLWSHVAEPRIYGATARFRF